MIYLSLEVEERFDVTLEQEDYDLLCQDRYPGDFTIGELHDYICEKCRRESRPVPPESWDLVRSSICDFMALDPEEVKSESWIVRDLGYS